MINKLNRGKNSAFSLMELNITAAILLIAIISMLAVFYGGMSLNESSKNYIIALNDARTAFERIRDTNPFTNTNVVAAYPASSAISGFSNLTSEQVVVTYPSGTAVEPLDITITVTWSERQRLRSTSLVTKMAAR